MLREGVKTVNSRSTAAPETVVGDGRWELVVRIAESSCFAKSARLRDFLLYVCRTALENHTGEISEQKIGQRVFHRPSDYNPNEDNIVRSHARLLRQKLEAYFAAEGASEPVILRIPKGGYVPEFVERPAVAEPTKPAPVQPARSDRLVAILAAAVALLSLTVALQSWLMMRTKPSASSGPSPKIAALWSQLFSEKFPTTIVIPDDTFAMLHEASGQPQTLESYLRRAAPDSPLQTLLPNFPVRRYTTYDGVTAALRIMQLAQGFPGRVVVRYARDIALRDLSPGNVILIGRPSSNLWTELFQPKLNFHIYFDDDRRHVVCKNTRPQPGEENEYVPQLQGTQFDAYSAVALVPNLNGGNVLVIRGSVGSSQEGAADFVTSETLLGRLAEKIGHLGARFPYFDVLLRTTTIDGMSQEPSMVAYRVLDGSGR